MCSPTIAISAGLSAFQGLAMQSAAKDAAEQTAEQERVGVKCVGQGVLRSSWLWMMTNDTNI